MGLNRQEVRRAEGYGYYTSYSSNAEDVLDYISGSMTSVESDRPWSGFDGKTFKVTITVEEE